MRKFFFPIWGLFLLTLCISCNNENTSGKIDNETKVSTTKSADSIKTSSKTIVTKKVFSPTRFPYLDHNDNNWIAEIIKVQFQGEAKPRVWFRHSLKGATHESANIDYVADAFREKWSATIDPQIDPATNMVTYSFYHVNIGGEGDPGGRPAHNDTVMRISENDGSAYEVSLQKSTLEEFMSLSDTGYIKVNIRMIRKPSTPPPPPPPICRGNGKFNFKNYNRSKPLYLYFWYAEDVPNGAEECKIRTLWRGKALDYGDNIFQLVKGKNMIYRIYEKLGDCSTSSLVYYPLDALRYCEIYNGWLDLNKYDNGWVEVIKQQ
jgi:hypothetical protein